MHKTENAFFAALWCTITPERVRLSKKEYQIRNHRKKTTQMILTFIPDYVIVSNDKIMHIIIMNERIKYYSKVDFDNE